MRVEYEDILPPEYLELPEVARFVKRSTRTLYEWVRTGQVRAVRQGRAGTFVNINDARKLVAQRDAITTAPPRASSVNVWEKVARRGNRDTP